MGGGGGVTGCWIQILFRWKLPNNYSCDTELDGVGCATGKVGTELLFRKIICKAILFCSFQLLRHFSEFKLSIKDSDINSTFLYGMGHQGLFWA